ncbi:Centromere-associated protein E [Fukomys damarensis]|uniref:Centromere-associated protein E n=1 Tax=Fukomys damarensis TaxID=885580 RepID=A0A091D4A9_FUKDA|nr:Centromere-associated protein E [Fukomys damarensis]
MHPKARLGQELTMEAEQRRPEASCKPGKRADGNGRELRTLLEPHGGEGTAVTCEHKARLRAAGGMARDVTKARPNQARRREELGEATQVYWKTDNNAIYQVDGSKSFNFDRVFHSNETTKNVYEEIAVPIIDSAIQGYNGTIFAYGQTASGKTHTMMGSEDCLGVIPRAIHDIFQKIKKFPEREFLLRVSYMEIYNETITDLLCSTQKMKPLIIREDINRNVYVADLTEEVVYTSEMALNWITKGEKSRHYGVTKMNQRSSRSHTIFRMILESREKGEPSNCDGSIKVSHLNLVDLAGSERAAQTGAEGVRLKEGCNINRSLFILGQVIKKLSDGQFGGFINYRDSKLTRILQNSLGGNAKTRIICTITPVSFDETLTTLQFASTAKYMKNTPYVNEVSSDEALLKRYRKEIVDLKKQLEEVNIKTRAQEMEKDQLAQLLDEKDSLQKVQDEKIQNLTRMLVTSSSLTSQQELKAKRKRRVTWCFGKINKMKESNYVNEFSMPANVTTRTHRSAVTLLGEIDESLCVESDFFSGTLDTLTEIEWNSATKLLNEENIESEFNSLRAKYDNLVLDYEQLRRENEEMGLKLKEKNDLDEFEALERKTGKDQEMQLIHEISNLKNLVKHAEVYNQDLEDELSSKVELLREKEAQIKNLQKFIDSQKAENAQLASPSPSENSEDPKQMRQSFFDAETVALDAKRESAFLRSENLELKEKMKELTNTCKQMEIDTRLYQGQLEAKKKMQIDLEKELQSAFNEITKLTSLVDGKLPKDLLCNLELERRITDLQKELNKEVKENEALQKEVNLLSELKSLPSEVEMLRKEIQDKSEELSVIASEKDWLCSEVTQKESSIQGLLEEIGKTKDDLATAQLNYKNTEQEFQDFKILHVELEQKYKRVHEESVRMKQEMGSLSEETEHLRLSLDAVKTELSHNAQKVQQKTAEDQERVREVEQLKEELERRGAHLQAAEEEKTLVTERLQQSLEAVRSLAQEKEALSQLRDSLQAERDQLRGDIRDTVSMNIDTQEQLRNALESLKQHQETINTLKMRISEESSRNLHTEENVCKTEQEFHQKMIGMDEKQSLEAETTGILIAGVKDSKVVEQQKKMCSLIREKNELQRILESITAEKEQLKTDLKENIEMTIENQEELRILGDELKRQQEIVAQEKNHAIEKDEELARTCEKLAEVEEKLKEKNEQLQEKQQQLLNTQEEMSEMQKKMNEMEKLKSERKNQESKLEHLEMERLELTQKLHENCEEMKSITKERDDLKELRESLEVERDQLKEYISKIEAAGRHTEQELSVARLHLQEHQETIAELRSSIAEKEAQIGNTQEDLEKSTTKVGEQVPVPDEEQKVLPTVKAGGEIQDTVRELEALEEQSTAAGLTETERLKLIEKFQESQEEIKCLMKEKDNLKMLREALEAERDQLKEYIRENSVKIQEAQDEQEQPFHIGEQGESPRGSDTEQLHEQPEAKDAALLRVEMEKLQLCQRLEESRNQLSSLAKERDDLQTWQEALQAERDQLTEHVREVSEKHQETEVELKVARCCLTEREETIDELRALLSEKETELAGVRNGLEAASEELQKIRELYEKQEQLISVKETSETQENMNELEKFKELLKTQDSTLQDIESDRLKLSRRLEESQEEIKIIIRERDELQREQEALQLERDQLKENLNETAAKLRELEVEQQCLRVKAASKTQETGRESEHLRELLEAQRWTLENMETEHRKLAQRLHENLKEIRAVTQERDELRSVLSMDRERLMGNLEEAKARDLEKQEEVRMAHLRLKELQGTVDELRGAVSEKTDEMASMRVDLENTNAALKEQAQELEKKEHQLLQVENNLKETVFHMEQLKKQVEAQNATLDSMEMERVRLTQSLSENREEVRLLTEENGSLRSAEKTLREEDEQLRKRLWRTEAEVLQRQEELRAAHMSLKEHRETTDELRRLISEKTDEVLSMKVDLENSSAKLQEKIRELKANEHLLFKLKEDVGETQTQLKDQSLTLSKMEMENLNLAQKLHENLEEMKSVAKERDRLRSMEEALVLERDRLKEDLQEASAKSLETQQELKTAHQHLKEQQETIEKFRKRVSEKTTRISNIQTTLDQSKHESQEKIQELQQKELQLLKVKEDVSKSHKKWSEMEQLRQQFEAQSVPVPPADVDNFHLTKKLQENLEEIRMVAKESRELRRMKEALERARGRCREAVRKVVARAGSELSTRRELSDRQPRREARNSGRRSPCSGEQPLAGSLKEKGLRIGELLKRYSEMDDHCECLNRLSLDLEKEIETQKELSARVKANLSPPHPQSKQIQRLLTASQRCSMEFHRVMKKLKYVLSHVTKTKEEQHNSINQLEMALVGEVEKQEELRAGMQPPQQTGEGLGTESRVHRLHQLMDQHIEEILKDFSENDFSSIKIEFQQILRNRKETTWFLEEWLSTHFDIEKLKDGIQKENNSIGQVNHTYNNKITAIINESTEFEERSSARCREWEQDLESAREESRALAASLALAHGDPASRASGSPQAPPGAGQLTTQKIQELESSLREAEESAVRKEDEIIKLQKELRMSGDVIAKLQAKVNESNKVLERTNDMIQALQDKLALGAKPYKEEIEDLKTKLVRSDLEKVQTAKEHEREITSAKATEDHQKEVIRLLRENLRRIQQAQDTSMISEPGDPQPAQKPLTCGGGSGIVQNTKVLILKSEHLRLEKELAKLKQQNERLAQQRGELLSNNQQLSNELKAWKEKAGKREAHCKVSCEALPKSPARVPGAGATRRPSVPAQCRERTSQDPVPQDSPKSRFFDPRSKSFPAPRPAHYFDNSSLGLCPEEQAVGTENVDPRFLPSAPLRDTPECRMQ